jgi:hypothetical protein
MRGVSRRTGFFVVCLLAILTLLHLELSVRPGLVAPVAREGVVASTFATVMPCTVRDAMWLVAKILSCGRTLSEQNTRVVLVMLPRRDVKAMQTELVNANTPLPPHWHLVPEDEILPALRNRPKIPGWNLQQALKLLARHHPLVALASPPIEYILTIDSDVVCALDWESTLRTRLEPTQPRQQQQQQQLAPQPLRDETASAAELALASERALAGTEHRPYDGGGSGSVFARAFTQGGRIRSCVERLSGWYGQRHMRMTARSFNFTDWLTEERAIPPRMQDAHVIGWTPQLLSVRALAEMEAELIRRVPSTTAPPGAAEAVPTAAFRRMAESTMWTEYFTYFLALDYLGSWSTHHEAVCPPEGTRIEPSSGRCPGELAQLKDMSPVLTLERLARLNASSTAVHGCLKVRVDCVQELLQELGHAVVPFITINDHVVKATDAVRAVQAKLVDPNRRADPSSTRRPARPCCTETRVLPKHVIGGFYRPSLRVLNVPCGPARGPGTH